MKQLTYFSRILIGFIFIASGFIKLIDPIGFSYKLEEYFSPGIFNLPPLVDFALALAIFLAIYEILLGWMLLLGMSRNFTLFNLFIFIIFFSALTFYSAYFDKVTDCGCFGDVLKLRPWEYFAKDILILFFILCLIGGRIYIKPYFSKSFRKIALLFFLVGSLFITYHGINHLPLIDFRPYAVGKSIPNQMKSAEELGLKSPQYQNVYTLKNQKDKRLIIVSDKEYIAQKLWENSDWQIQSDKTQRRKIKNGYEPLIDNFLLEENGNNVTEKILSQPISIWVIDANPEKIDQKGLNAVQGQFNSWKEIGLSPLWFSSTKPEDSIEIPWISADATLLKTIIRSDPGIVLLKKGRIIKKWHWRDAPGKGELRELIKR
ncbi:BT_3928 family protein [Bacteroidetes bacterium endosymbiont of Geopemphigus sp.]|uniref:BT_3928 family protein n=1 Tax=Bacteroidetes bacterium endosymbiont of Geopemphigus sp. TaxID=2047937 RepID=UPI000CD1CE30|nr:BT_3928 family protein [Bacteroidetes bacterium endosymbiont of Geopemphigus sp.]